MSTVGDRLNRHDLSEEEWQCLSPLLPVNPRQGGRWADHRLVINGVFFRTRTGCPWRDLPECYGNWKTVYNRHRRWSLDGTWAVILDRLRAGCDEAEGKDWTVGVDSTIVRAHHHAAGAHPAARGLPGKGDGVDHESAKNREGLGRSRGGLTTKIHLAADRRCRPIARLTSAGQRGDSPYFIRVMGSIRILRRGLGRPRRRPARALADKAYSSRGNRAYLRRRGIRGVIPEKRDQQANRLKKGRKGGRPPAFDVDRYKERNTVERCIGKLKAFRAVAMRFDKRERIYQGTIDVASIKIWLRDPVP
ncbi:IS5 family transposase [Sphaerisporangium sp. NPDC051011]|uniref:IS5 family transposase n=1 Tax=Sphaerisporangium sp. NPDC051011 TaxID=3155792 RepID=UPI0033EEE748